MPVGGLILEAIMNEEARRREVDKRAPGTLGSNVVETPAGTVPLSQQLQRDGSPASFILGQVDMSEDRSRGDLEKLATQLSTQIQNVQDISLIPDPQNMNFVQKRLYHLRRALNPSYMADARAAESQFKAYATANLASQYMQVLRRLEPDSTFQETLQRELAKQVADLTIPEVQQAVISGQLKAMSEIVGRPLTEQEQNSIISATFRGFGQVGQIDDHLQRLGAITRLAPYISKDTVEEHFPEFADDFDNIKSAHKAEEARLKPMTEQQAWDRFDDLVRNWEKANTMKERRFVPLLDSSGQPVIDIISQAPKGTWETVEIRRPGLHDEARREMAKRLIQDDADFWTPLVGSIAGAPETVQEEQPRREIGAEIDRLLQVNSTNGTTGAAAAK